MAQSNYLILTFDGGGIRGIVPALLVQQLNQEFPDLLERINLFAGTSTGGLIAIGLASEVPIAAIVDVYLNQGGEVFKKYGSLTTAATQELIHVYPEAALLLPSLLHVKYTAAGLKNVVEHTFPTYNQTLSQLNRKLLVTAFDLYQGAQKPWAPISLTNLQGSPTDDILVLDAALSTTAGPVYFPPHVFDHRGETKALIDGGVYANNPSMLAAASVIASGTLTELGLTSENIKLLSIGTGFTVNSIPPENQMQPPDLYGVLAWMFPLPKGPTPQFPLLEILMDGVASIDTFQCEQVLGDKFRRANVTLTEPIDPDDVEAVPALVRMTADYMASNQWRDIKDWIRREFV